jgi:carbon dioxide concentrating mechanism protein CcmL
MRLGKVIGRVTLGKTGPEFAGARWLLVTPYNRDFLPVDAYSADDKLSTEPSVVIYDSLGAGVGDTVGFIEGREAASPFVPPIAIDAISGVLVDTINYQPQS